MCANLGFNPHSKNGTDRFWGSLQHGTTPNLGLSPHPAAPLQRPTNPNTEAEAVGTWSLKPAWST